MVIQVEAAPAGGVAGSMEGHFELTDTTTMLKFVPIKTTGTHRPAQQTVAPIKAHLGLRLKAHLFIGCTLKLRHHPILLVTKRHMVPCLNMSLTLELTKIRALRQT